MCHTLFQSQRRFQQEAVAHSWVYCQRSYSWAGRISRLITVTYLLCNPTSLFHPRAQAVAGHSGRSCTVELNNTVLPTSRHAVPRTCLTTPCRQLHGYMYPSNKCVWQLLQSSCRWRVQLLAFHAAFAFSKASSHSFLACGHKILLFNQTNLSSCFTKNDSKRHNMVTLARPLFEQKQVETEFLFAISCNAFLATTKKCLSFIKGSLEEILPSYEKLRSMCAHVCDAKESRLTVACVGTLDARVRRVCGACAASTSVEIEA